MNITFLGTGTSQGVPVIACHCNVCMSDDSRDKRLRCSIHIEVEGKSLVIDTGPDFRQQMLRAGIEHLDAILMTHEHKDHIAGLDDIRAFNFKQKKEMDVYATEQVQYALKREFHYVFSESKYPGIPQVNLKTIDKNPINVEGIPIRPIEVLHYKMPVLGFRIKDFAYITDAKTIEKKELDKLKGTKHLVLNALRREDHISHLTLDEAIELGNIVQPEMLYLTHISHLMGKHSDVEKTLPPNVKIAFDGLILNL